MGKFWVARHEGADVYVLSLSPEYFLKIEDGIWRMESTNHPRGWGAYDASEFERWYGITLAPGEGPVEIKVERA